MVKAGKIARLTERAIVVRKIIQMGKELMTLSNTGAVEVARPQHVGARRRRHASKFLSPRWSHDDGSVLHAQPATIFAPLQHAIDHRVGESHRRRNARRRRLQFGNHRRQGGPVGRFWREATAGWGGMAGEIPIHAAAVGGVGMTHRADDRQLLGVARQQRQVFADRDPGGGGGDGLEFPAYLTRCPRLGIERIDVAHATPQVDDDQRFRGALCVLGRGILGRRLKRKHCRQ